MDLMRHPQATPYLAILERQGVRTFLSSFDGWISSVARGHPARRCCLLDMVCRAFFGAFPISET